MDSQDISLPLFSTEEVNTEFSWVQLPVVDHIGLMARAGGFRGLILDWEHGSFTESDLKNVSSAIEAQGLITGVRLPAIDRYFCSKAVDLGFSLILAPYCNDKYIAQKFVDWCKYPPEGSKGVGYCFGTKFGAGIDVVLEGNHESCLVGMIETEMGVNSISEICGVSGVDAIFVGPYDLSCSLGCPGDFTNPLFKSALEELISACKSNSKPIGMHCVSGKSADVRSLIDSGFNFVVRGMDTSFLEMGLRLE